MKVKILIFSLIFLSFQESFSQKLKEDDIVSFRVYDRKTYPKDKTYPNFSADDISKMTYAEIPNDSLKGAFGKPSRFRTIKKKKKEGSYFATIDLKNGERKVITISGYSCIFHYVNSNKRYIISFDNESRQLFHSRLMAACKKLNPEENWPDPHWEVALMASGREKEALKYRKRPIEK